MPPAAVDTDRRPFVLVWELTQACALACRHCRADARPERHPDELTTAEGRALLADAARFGEGQLVVLSGGDPLARDDVTELVAFGDERGLRMTMTPSGTASLTPERIGALADAGLRRLALSLDGATAAAHDEFRGEPGSFRQTLDAVSAAADADLPLQVNTTVCAATAGELPALRDLVADLGAVLWSVFFLVPVGRGALLDPVSPARAERLMGWLADVADEAPFGVKTTEAPHYRRVVRQRAAAERDGAGEPSPPAAATDGGRGVEPAATGTASTERAAAETTGGPPSADGIGRRVGVTAGDGFAFVSHRGDVYPSGFLPLSAGNVRETPVVELYRDSELFRSLREPDALRGKCGACPFNRVCGGSRSRAFAHTGDPLESDPLCAYVPPGYDGPLPEAWADRPAGWADA